LSVDVYPEVRSGSSPESRDSLREIAVLVSIRVASPFLENAVPAHGSQVCVTFFGSEK
jgi:hypothetical protein